MSTRGMMPPTMDGKVFFKNVKARLSEEAFNEFLLNIKRLNGKVQTKSQTLINVAKLFGKENDDLYQNFETIITPMGNFHSRSGIGESTNSFY